MAAIDFNKNKESLLSRFPDLEQKFFQRYQAETSLEIITTRKGELSGKLNGLALHSKYDPRREAERIVDSTADDVTDCGVFIGFGLGYTVEVFMDRYPEAEVLLYEPDPAVLLRVLREKDFSQLFSQDRFGLLLGIRPENLATCLQKMHCREIRTFTLQAISRNYPELCLRAENAVQKFLSRRQVNINTLKKFGKRWVKNLCRNMERYNSALSIHELAGRFGNIPALLIAAGPSLDGAIPFLKELQERFLVIAVDTVSRALERARIEPDFVLSVDPQYWNSRHLDPVTPGKSILITDSAAYPATFRKFREPYILCPSSFPLAETIEQELNITGKLYSGGSVATAAWEVARVLGCPSIHCIGLDLSYPEKQTHYTGSFFEQRLHSLSTRTLPVSQTNWHIL